MPNNGFAEGPGGQDPNPGAGSGGGDWIGALINAGSTVYSGEVAKRNTDKTIEANKEQAKYAYSQELEQWNRQNEYNSPASQMARLKAAGLNPNSIYGNGSSSTGNATQYPKYNAPNLQYNYKPLMDASVLSGYQDFRMRQAQIDNVKAQTENVRSRTVTEAARNALVTVQGKRGEVDLEQKNYQMPFQNAIKANEAFTSEAKLAQEWKKVTLMNQEEQLRNLEASYRENAIGMQGVEAEKKQAELAFSQYRNEWMKMGVTSSDNVMLRIFVRMMNQSGLTDWIPKQGPNFDKLKD